MSALSVIVMILVASIVAPIALRLHRSPLVWATLLVVNVIIITVFVVVRDSSPEKIGHRSDPGALSAPVDAESVSTAKK